jgi:hypothetical protein
MCGSGVGEPLLSPKEFHPAIPQGSVFIHPFTEHSLDLGETELFYPTRRISHHSIVRTFSKEQGSSGCLNLLRTQSTQQPLNRSGVRSISPFKPVIWQGTLGSTFHGSTTINHLIVCPLH